MFFKATKDATDGETFLEGFETSTECRKSNRAENETVSFRGQIAEVRPFSFIVQDRRTISKVQEGTPLVMGPYGRIKTIKD